MCPQVEITSCRYQPENDWFEERQDMKKRLALALVLLLGVSGLAFAAGTSEGEPGGHGICKQVGKLLICPLM